MIWPKDRAHITAALTLTAAVALAGCSRAPAPAPTGESPAAEKGPPPPTARGDAPNLFLIVLDTVRRDHLSTYGYSRETSPALTRLAGDGVLFEGCVSPAAWTHPAHGSMLTGAYPSSHGARYAGVAGKPAEAILALDPRRPLLQRLLGEAGYRTVASVGAPVLAPALGVTRGFQVFHGAFPAAEPTAREVNERLLAAVDAGEGERPLFALVNYYDAHGPYVARREHAPWLGDSVIRQVDLAASRDGLPRFARLAAGKEEIAPAELAAAVDNYDSEIARVDHALGELVAGLRSRGLLENALVAITSDHGEYFGEHGLYEHGRTLYRQLTEVPLVILGSGARKGAKVETPVQLGDLFPTFLEAAGVPVPGNIRASSLGPLITGEGKHEAHPIASEAFADPAVAGAAPVYAADYRSARRGKMKLVTGGAGKRQLFDLDADPGETNDLSATATAAADELSRLLDLWLPPASSRTAPAAISPGTRERLRALGYLD